MLSKTCGYAIRGLAYLAMKAGEHRKIGLQELARELAVPPHFMGKIMQDLARRAVIGSTKGPNGGFFLNDRTLGTSILQVVDALDGPGVFQRCQLGLPTCSAEDPCPLHHEVAQFRDAFREKLRLTTIGDLVADLRNGLAHLAGPLPNGPLTP
jgi:Rrf2 family protein